MKQFCACQPRPAKSASASLIPAWIFSAVMPGGNAGSEKSTVAGSKPTNRTRFICPPKPRPYSAEPDRNGLSRMADRDPTLKVDENRHRHFSSNGTDQQEADDKHHRAGYTMNGERSRLRPARPVPIKNSIALSILTLNFWNPILNNRKLTC